MANGKGASCFECMSCQEQKKKLEKDMAELEAMRSKQLRSRFGPPPGVIAAGGGCDAIGLGEGTGAAAMNKYVQGPGLYSGRSAYDNIAKMPSGSANPGHWGWFNKSGGKYNIPWCASENALKKKKAELDRNMEKHKKCRPSQDLKTRANRAGPPTVDDFAKTKNDYGRAGLAMFGGVATAPMGVVPSLAVTGLGTAITWPKP